MKKIIGLCLVVLVFTLSGCTESSVGCAEGLTLEDGVCFLEEDNQPLPEDEEQEEQEEQEEEEELPAGSCVMDINDYSVSDYEMVWNDEFETDGMLDDTKWEYLIGNGGSYGIPGWGNGELQYYSNDLKNVEVKDGELIITATTEGYAQYGYTSGRVRTMNLGDFQYGVVEVCAKMPDTLGTWPAIWMLPTDSPYGGWPNGGEIDIMEAVGFESNTVHFNIHTKNDNWGNGQSVGSHSTINNIATEYHRYGIKWLENKIIFYVDGVQEFTYTPVNDEYGYWPFDTEFHLILNIAVGGAWGGIRGIEEGNWDDSMYVDYVRVYQEK